VPFFTLPLSAGGPVLDAAVLVSAARLVALEAAGSPVPPLVQVRALLDTGASCSAVDQEILDSLGLVPTGEAELLTPSTGRTPQRAFTYDVQVGIFAGRPGDLHFISDTVQVMASDLYVGQEIHMLIGRDILARCILNYNGADGIFTLAY
jgi:hypothetical protein